VRFAKSSPYPSVDTILDNVYAGPPKADGFWGDKRGSNKWVIER
jgi:hypothetical protein